MTKFITPALYAEDNMVRYRLLLAVIILVAILTIIIIQDSSCNLPDWNSCGLPAPGSYTPDINGVYKNEHGQILPSEWIR